MAKVDENRYHGGPKVLVFDIETALREYFAFSPKVEYLPKSNLKKDSHLLSFAAWWKGRPRSEVIYMDVRHEKSVENDLRLVERLCDLLDEADIVEGYNSDRFDIRVVNARVKFWKLKPPSTFKKLDVMKIVRKHYELPYYSMEYVAEFFGVGRKLKHKRFPGIELWKECALGNIAAFEEMRKYNIQDVFTCDEILDEAAPWHKMPNLDVWFEDKENICWCGSKEFKANGKQHTDTGVFQRYRCIKCGHEKRSRKNLLEKTKKSFLLLGTNR